eukprot:g32383.t1
MMKIPVLQMSGEAVIVDVLPEMTIQELKRQLKDLLRADDESMKAVTMVELLVGETKLTDDQTVVEAGLSEDVVLQVFFTVRSVECSHQNEVGRSLRRQLRGSSDEEAPHPMYTDKSEVCFFRSLGAKAPPGFSAAASEKQFLRRSGWGNRKHLGDKAAPGSDATLTVKPELPPECKPHSFDKMCFKDYKALDGPWFVCAYLDKN